MLACKETLPEILLSVGQRFFLPIRSSPICPRPALLRGGGKGEGGILAATTLKLSNNSFCNI